MLKLQYFGQLMGRTDSLQKTLRLGKIEGRRKGQQKKRWLDGITDSIDFEQTPGHGEGQSSLACCICKGLNTTQRLKINKRRPHYAVFCLKTIRSDPPRILSPSSAVLQAHFLLFVCQVFPWVDSLPSCSR